MGSDDPHALLFSRREAMGKEFASYRQKSNIGASLIVMAPTGRYDPAKLINIGANRWSFKPEIGLSRAFRGLVLDAYLGIWLFTANNNFRGGKRK